MSDDARSEILARVRAALTDVPSDEPAFAEPVPTAPPAVRAGADLAELFAERVEDYRATVTRCAADEVTDAVGELCARHAAARLACPAGLPSAWLPPGVEILRDDPPLAVDVLDGLDGVITGAAAGIAETGTILLDGGHASGRRALTLVPDLHICVLTHGQVVASVPEGLAAVHAAVRAGRPITMVSGPSATSDIELDRVEGVHGPRRLEVLLVDAVAPHALRTPAA